MKSESAWKTKLVSDAKTLGWYARRVEDQFGVGFPDTIFKIPTLGVAFVEAKMLTSRYYAPSPRQWVDLVALHDPSYFSFGIVLGIREAKDGAIFSFSTPAKKIDDTAESTFHHVNFHQGLRMFMDQIRRQL